MDDIDVFEINEAFASQVRFADFVFLWDLWGGGDALPFNVFRSEVLDGVSLLPEVTGCVKTKGLDQWCQT